MTTFRSFFAVVLLLLGMSLGTNAADSSWKGWITDSHCGASGAHPGDKECALRCVKKGAKFVLVNDADMRTYLLDPQDKVAAYAGEHVLIQGTSEGHTLKFISIEPIPQGPRN